MKIVSRDYVIEQMQSSIQDLATNTALDQVIEDVTAQIERYLGRTVSVTRYDEDVRRYRLTQVGSLVQYIARYRPVVYAYGDDFNDSFIMQDQGVVSYLSGYLLAEQTKANIVNEFNLPYDVDIRLHEVPNDMKRVALKLIAYELTSAAQNTFGYSSKTVVTGGTVANIERRDPEFVNRELRKLDQFIVVDA